MPDQWSRYLFLALCRRYGLQPYRLYRQRRNTVMVRARKGSIDDVLWPEFNELHHTLQAYLQEVTLRIIRAEVHADASEAPEGFRGADDAAELMTSCCGRPRAHSDAGRMISTFLRRGVTARATILYYGVYHPPLESAFRKWRADVPAFVCFSR